ncbi:MAG: GNAT family N-acetyltransferase [Desulfovibrio sp.]|jgi:hypothetical protein|nr:GNAT family N-acetyltransferase [Desulfovibrio sp.]
MEFINIAPDSSPEQQRLWKRAAVGTNQADPFCCAPAWQLAFHEAFSPKRRLLVEGASNSVIAFAEKVFSPDNVYLTPIEVHWLFGCPLLGRYAVELFTDALACLEKEYRPFFPRILISGIRPGGILAARLLRTFGGEFRFFLQSRGVQCAASLAGGLDGFFSRRSANHRHKLKKQARRAAEAGVIFERVAPASPGEAAAAYARILAVELTSWKGMGRCGMAEPPSRLFYDVLLRRLSATRAVRIIFAKYEDRDIGFIFGGLAKNIYRGQQFSYADEWKDFSIGNLMQVEKIRWLCEEGVRRYDMGPLSGPRMGYKSHWTEKEIRMQSWILERK